MWWVPLAAAAVSAAGSYFGGQQANKANSANAAAQMQFQAQQAQGQEDYGREMWARNADYNQTEATRAWERELSRYGMEQDFAREMTGRQEAFQRESSQRAMDFDIYSSSTAWQRGVEDMKAAGINPLLAYQRGGASTPTMNPTGGSTGDAAGPSASVAASPGMPSRSAQSGAMARVENIIGPAVSSAVQAAGVTGQLRQTDSLIDVQKANAAAQRANAILTLEQASTQPHVRRQIDAQIESELQNPALRRAQASQALASASESSQSAGAISRRNERFDTYGDSPAGDIIHSGVQMGRAVAPTAQRGASAVGAAGARAVEQARGAVPGPTSGPNQETADYVNRAVRHAFGELLRRLSGGSPQQ